MDAAEVIKTTVNHAHGWFDGTTANLTQEQADYLPSSTAHPIGELVAHLIQSEDVIVNGMLQGKPSVWESGGLGAEARHPQPRDAHADQARGITCDIAALQPYKEAVYTSVQS